MEIFEQYFYDLNQVARVPGNEYVYADPDDILEEKLQIFQHEEVLGPTIPSYVHRVYRIDTTGKYFEIDNLLIPGGNKIYFN